MFEFQKYGQSKALFDDDGRCISYSTLNSIVIRIGGIIGNGYLVLIKADNTLESIICYLACIRSRNVIMLVSEYSDEETVEKYIRNYKINYFIDGTKTINSVDEELLLEGIVNSITLVNGRRTDVNSELVLLLPTSGSTGSEKMVRISRKNLESNTKSICNYLNITSNDVAITSLPMNYTYGLSVINTHLYAGARIVVTKKLPYMNEFWNICRQNNVTSFSGVPYTYEILRKMNFFPANIESLKTFTVAGGRLDSEEEEYFSKYSIENNKKFIIMYGQTEATARISYRPPDMLMDKPGSIGIAIPGGKIWIEDESGKVLDKPFQHGEIVYRGENVSMGYAYEAGDLDRGYEWGEILHTGDIGYMDEQGYFYITGRKDKVVKLNGKRIDLTDMEKMLNSKFMGYIFRCEIEKCLDKMIPKRICISVSRECHKDNVHKSVEECEIKNIVEFVSGKLHMNRRLFVVKLMINESK